jgi:hypothetical protein
MDSESKHEIWILAIGTALIEMPVIANRLGHPDEPLSPARARRPPAGWIGFRDIRTFRTLSAICPAIPSSISFSRFNADATENGTL